MTSSGVRAFLAAVSSASRPSPLPIAAAFFMMCAAAAEASEIVLTTRGGRGADGFVSRTAPGRVFATSADSGERERLKSGGVDDLKTYLRFDLRDLPYRPADVGGVRLELTTLAGMAGRYAVYGIRDGASGDAPGAWSHKGLTWTTAPQNREDGAYGMAGDAALLFHFVIPADGAGAGTLTLDSARHAALGHFVRGDTNRLVTLVILQHTRTPAPVEWASGRHSRAEHAPRLVLTPRLELRPPPHRPAGVVRQGLQISLVGAPDVAGDRSIQQYRTDQDASGNTRIRFFEDRILPPAGKPLPPDTPYLKEDAFANAPNPSWYYFRDRDLGQIFTTGANGFYLEAITLRTGPDPAANQGQAGGARVSLQLFSVSGPGALNDNGTTGADPAAWETCCGRTAFTDDFIEGLGFTPLLVATGATLPAEVRNDQYLRWELTEANRVWLEPYTRYAFMILFEDPANDRGLAFANRNGASSGLFPESGDHAIRREGQSTVPQDVFIRDLADPQDVAASARSATLPRDRAERYAVVPGSLGYPDVCTWREFVYFIHGRSDEPHVAIESADGTGAARPGAALRVRRDGPGRHPVEVFFTVERQPGDPDSRTLQGRLTIPAGAASALVDAGEFMARLRTQPSEVVTVRLQERQGYRIDPAAQQVRITAGDRGEPE